jgi:predicted alpha/beta-hydrolase family hydrolase
MKSAIAPAVPFSAADVQGFLHRPADHSRGALVLTHGAGSNCKAPLLVAMAEAFASEAVTVLRCNLPFRQQRPSGPPLPAIGARDRQGLLRASEELRNIASGPLFIAGHSYGGRQASILVASDPHICSGLLLLSYPLHPPNKPDQNRTEHFSALRTPSFFVHGTRDPFGSIEELTAALRLISAPHQMSTIQNAGHDLLRGRFDMHHQIIEPFIALLAL